MIIEVFAPCSATASAAVVKTGTPSSSQVVPPRLGWVPATTWVP